MVGLPIISFDLLHIAICNISLLSEIHTPLSSYTLTLSQIVALFVKICGSSLGGFVIRESRSVYYNGT